MTDPGTTADLTIVPANEAGCEDLQAVFGNRGEPSRCLCQRFKTRGRQWDAEHASVPVEDRAARLREQTRCGQPEADATSGLVAYLDGEPVGWCAVEPRTAYVRLGSTPWAGRAEDKTDDSVWALTCFVTRAGFRRRGVSRALVRAAVDFARGRGARALEGYPMITQPGQDITWGEIFVGSRSVFAAAGFAEVSHPTLRRVVMRIDFY
jgi:GNAT superfamily N-acetyltransferase